MMISHRPSQRRLVPLLPEADPPADGPRLPARIRCAAPTSGRSAARRCTDGLDREYTLNEIAIITRAAPARRLGLRDKGHLGIGADADVTIYHDRADREEMFATPRYVIKAGELAVEDGELRRADDGLLLSSRAAFDPEVNRRPRAAVRRALHGGVRALPGARPGAARTRSDRGGSRMSGYAIGATEVADTFAEAFPMRYARLLITAATESWAYEAARSATGFATSVIGCKCEAAIERALAAGRDPRRTAGDRGAAVRDGPRGRRQARGRARRPMRPDLPDHGVLRRAAGGREDGAAGCRPALLRRRLSGQQGDRGTALLADPGDGGRVSGQRLRRRRQGRRRWEPRDRGRRRRRRAGQRSGGRRRDARERHRAAVPGRNRPQRQQGRRAAPRNRCPPPPTIRWRRRCAPRYPTRSSPTASARCSRSSSTASPRTTCAKRCGAGCTPPPPRGPRTSPSANFGGKLGEFHFPLSELRDPP